MTRITNIIYLQKKYSHSNRSIRHQLQGDNLWCLPYLRVVLQNRRKFTIDYRIESAAHNRLYHRLLQLKFLKATSFWVFIHYALSIIKQYIFTFIQLHIYFESVNYIDLCRRVTSKCWHLSKIYNYHYIGLCHFSALVDSLIPIQVHVYLKKMSKSTSSRFILDLDF